MSAPLDLFAACAPGLEPLLAAELAALGALDARPLAGGVAFRGHRRVLYRANLECGLATHVLVRLARFGADRFEALEAELAALPWERWLLPGAPRRVRASAHKSRLHHTGAIVERAERAIALRLGDAPQDDEERAVPIALRLVRDEVHVSLDTSGAPLHRRGYRTTSGPAPLREDLARALVIVSGWDRASPLVDPLSGIGTIPIEAALYAEGRAPGAGRAFAFERTALLDEASWARVREASAAARREAPPILGRDADPRAIAASEANAARAGVTVRFEVATLRAAPALDAPRGAVVTHPPFGKRLGAGEDLAPLYRALGACAPRGWALAILTADRRLGMRAGQDLATAFLTDAGGLKVRALVRRSGGAR
ncbi:MAG: RNA methyltransferase [Sandaracinaceae bacterium]|nr:RNA methyltransferase [Sandaracinaceae bacterium]